jgi:hypothetical protein
VDVTHVKARNALFSVIFKNAKALGIFVTATLKRPEMAG